MANVEKGSHVVKEEIELEQGSNAVVLITKTTQKDVFLGPEDALKKTKLKLSDEYFKSYGLVLIGTAGILGGISLIGPSASGKSDGIGELAIMAGTLFMAVGYNSMVKTNLISRQVEKLKAVLGKNTAPKQKH